MSEHTPSPRKERMKLTERGRNARDSVIALGAIGLGLLGFNHLQDGAASQQEDDRTACTYQIPAGLTLNEFSIDYLGAETDGEVELTSRRLARESGLNNKNDVGEGHILNLDAAQCDVAEMNGASVTRGS